MKKILIGCECQGEVLELTRFEDESEVYFTLYKYSFPSVSFFRRIKMVIKVLRGIGISTGDIVLSEEKFNLLKEF